MATPLDGLRVIDLTCGPAGGIATMVLADFGANVHKIDPPGGDPFESLAAAPMWLRGKHRTTLDLKTPAGGEQLHELVRSADAVVAAYRPGVAERLHADYPMLAAVNPRLVYCTITGFGPRGPYSHYKGYEGLVAAASGRMMTFAGQLPRPGPAYAAVQVGTHAASQSAVQGILAALLVRDHTGRGQLVETSLLQGMLPYDLTGLTTQQLMRRFPAQFPVDPLTARQAQPTLQYQPVLTKDGRWMQLGNLMEHLFHSYIAAAGLSHIYADPRFATAPNLPDDDREALREVMLARMREQTLDEWMAIFMADGNIAAEEIVSARDALRHPQLAHNGQVVELDDPHRGRMTQVGLLAKLPRTPGSVGNHQRTEVSAGVSDARHAPDPVDATGQTVPASTTPRPRHPLEGVTVVEFATIIATPYACSLLADLGARVIKVEALEGDGLRNLASGMGATKTTAGKESICIDMKSKEGQGIARRLVERADILVHNYRPGVPERLGIGYEDVRAYNPEIVYVSATGYGSDGPHAHRPSAHPIAGAAMGGALWQAGAGMPPDPTDSIAEIREFARRFMRANELNPDPNTSMVIATAALLGLHARRTHGVGQHVQTNMMIGNAYANFDDFLAYDGKPERPLVDRDLHGLHALYRLYQCGAGSTPDASTGSGMEASAERASEMAAASASGPDPATSGGWIFLACPFEEEWQALCRALERTELLHDPRFATEADRRMHDTELAALLGTIFCTRPAASWERLLTAHDIGCVRADRMTTGEFWDRDEHALRAGFVREAEHLRWGPYWRHGPLVTFSDTPERAGAGVLAGQHTLQLLREHGYSPDEIAVFRATDVVRSEEP